MRLLKGLGALFALVAIIVGIPAALLVLSGNPLSGALELFSLDTWTTPSDLGLFLTIVTLAGWIAWATLAWAIFAEIIAAIRGVTISAPTGLSWQHASARPLVKAVMLLGAVGAPVSGTAIAGADTVPHAPSAETTITSSPEAGQQAAGAHAPLAATNPASDHPGTVITTTGGDTLWGLAETHLGDGERWTEIRDANPDLGNAPFLPTGAHLTIPAVPGEPADGEITIVAGDCLWDLAETHLGDGERWTEIRDANPSHVHGPENIIYIGDVLALPTVAAAAPTTPAPDTAPAPESAVPETNSPSAQSPAPQNASPTASEPSFVPRANADAVQTPTEEQATETPEPSAPEQEDTGTEAAQPTAQPADDELDATEPAASTEPDVAAAPVDVMGDDHTDLAGPTSSTPAMPDVMDDDADSTSSEPSSTTESAETSAPTQDAADEDDDLQLANPDSIPGPGETSTAAEQPYPAADDTDDTAPEPDVDDSADAPAEEPVAEPEPEVPAPAATGDIGDAAENEVAAILGGAAAPPPPAPDQNQDAEPQETDSAPVDEVEESASVNDVASEPADDDAPEPTGQAPRNPDLMAPTEEAEPTQPSSSPAPSSSTTETASPTTSTSASSPDVMDDDMDLGNHAVPPAAAAPPEAPAPAPEPGPDGPGGGGADDASDGIGSTFVPPQPEAESGSDDQQKIADQAAAAASGGMGLVDAPDDAASQPPTQAAPPTTDADPNLVTQASNIDKSSLAVLSAMALLGLASILGWRRRRQQHDRPRGERISRPDRDTADVIAMSSSDRDPLALADVNKALRHLDQDTSELPAPPRLVGVTLGDRIVDVAVVDDIVLDDPWRRSGGGWSVDPRRLDAVADTGKPAPWPALVPVGTDPDGGQFMVNLEDVGHLAVNSDDVATARFVLQAMAVELAMSPLADEDTHVHVVGFAKDLPEVMENGRLTHHDSVSELLAVLDAEAARSDDQLASDGLDTVAEARRQYTSSDYTAPHLVLCAAELSEDQADRLAELSRVARLACAIVSSTAARIPDGWSFDIDADRTAVLHAGSGDGVELTAAMLDDDQLAAVINVLADEKDEPLPGQEDTVRLSAVPDVEPSPWASDHVTVRTPEASDPSEAPEPTPSDTPNAEVEDGQVSATSAVPVTAVPAATTTDLDHVWIRILGEPTLFPLNPGKVEDKRIGMLTELAVLLHLEGDTTHQELDTKLWPRDPHDKVTDITQRKTKKSKRRQQILSRLRAWIGNTATGEEAFPKVGDRTGNASYRLNDTVTSDWQHFNDLVDQQPHELDVEVLERAMSLVDGQPLSLGSRRATAYGWADTHRQDMISKVADVAEELAGKQIAQGRTSDALRTAMLGIEVSPEREGVWRMAIIAQHGLGGSTGREETQQLIDRMLTEMTELEVDLEPQTVELLDELRKSADAGGDPLYDISAQAS